MSNAALEKLIWVLIYGGLLTVCLGLFTARESHGLGWGMVMAGGLVALIGAVLIVVRARRSETPRTLETQKR